MTRGLERVRFHGVVGGGWQIARVLTSDGLLVAFDDYRPAAPVAPASCAELDELTGGMVPGRVWIVVSVPGEGRTSLLTQWAAEIAKRPEMTVHLVTPREPPAVIVTRLLAYTGRIPLNHLAPQKRDEIRPEHLARARGLVEALSLCLYAMGEDKYVPEVHPHRAAMKPTAVIIDDADLVSGITPEAVAGLAKAGLFVLLSLPRHQVRQTPWDEADLDPVWALRRRRDSRGASPGSTRRQVPTRRGRTEDLPQPVGIHPYDPTPASSPLLALRGRSSMTSVGHAIRTILGNHSAGLVHAYFDPENRFAGATFETLEPNDPGVFSASDLLGAGLLDVPFLPRAVRTLLQTQRDAFNALLAAVPNDVDLWQVSDEELQPAYALWAQVRQLDGVGPTRASKLMARKRPRLIPVVDSVVRTGLQFKEDDSWKELRTALRENDGSLVTEIEILRPEGLTERVSTLRILDAALWMNLSRSTHVKPFRDA